MTITKNTDSKYITTTMIFFNAKNKITISLMTITTRTTQMTIVWV